MSSLKHNDIVKNNVITIYSDVIISKIMCIQNYIALPSIISGLQPDVSWLLQEYFCISGKNGVRFGENGLKIKIESSQTILLH